MLRSVLALCAASSCASVAAAAAASDISSAFTNTRVTRKISASKHVVVANTTFTIKGNGGSKYYLAYTDEEAAHIAEIRADLDGAAVAPVLDSSIQVPGFVHYLLRLGKAVTADEPATLSVITTSTGVLTPKPTHIEQKDAQLVVLHFNAHVTSPYASDKQSSVLSLGTTHVEGHATSPAPLAVEGARLKAGPYSGVPAYSVERAWVHFENGSPFATLRSLLREIEVSHWGNVAVEEHYTLAHDGAALARGFSRIDYQTRGARAGSFNALSGSLPAGATDVYYRDVIGNISTSHVRAGGVGGVLMEIETRFPLFGGWKTEWYQGYNVPAQRFLDAAADGTFTLTFDAHAPFHELPVADFVTKVVLPEGAVVLSVDAPFPHTVTQSRRWTYLDGPFAGRAIAVIRASGVVVSGETHVGNLRVTYRIAPGYSVWAKAAYLTVAFLLLFVLASIASRLDLSLGPVRASKTKRE